MANIKSHSISADDPDWSRERIRKPWDPGRQLLFSIRRYQYWKAKHNIFARIICWRFILKHRFWSIITGADIPLNSNIGGGLLIPHPNGIVINPKVVVGPNCLIFQQVTLGSNGKGVPNLGGHVDIGAGAKVLGNISIGDHTRIGANAVVTKDVESGVTVGGIPAAPISNHQHIH